MATEMQRNSNNDIPTETAPELDPNALAAIRDLIQTEPEIAPQPVAEREAAQAAVAVPAPEPKPRRVRPEAAGAHEAFEPSEPVRAEPAPAARSKVKTGPGMKAGFVAGIKARVTGYRPTPKHLIIGSFALLVLFRPWLVAGVLFLSVLVAFGVFLILGYDGFWRRAMGLARWYAHRRPSRAAELHRKLDSFAMKWDAILDRFPEGSVDGLYLPDFGDLATADKRHDEALDRRFSNLNESGA